MKFYVVGFELSPEGLKNFTAVQYDEVLTLCLWSKLRSFPKKITGSYIITIKRLFLRICVVCDAVVAILFVCHALLLVR